MKEKRSSPSPTSPQVSLSTLLLIRSQVFWHLHEQDFYCSVNYVPEQLLSLDIFLYIKLGQLL